MVQKRILFTTLTAAALFSFLNWNCTKLDTTSIGSDLLPAVDNVHTFADTLDITSTQGIFNDTTRVINAYDFVLGAINNDPLFGKTKASVFFQLKPNFYPFYFGNEKDTLTGYPEVGLDSVVLCLAYRGFWGDSSLPVQLEVREVVSGEFRDSIYKIQNINFAPTTAASVLATANVDVTRLADTVKYANKRDYSINLIRIKMPMSWANTLFGRDSLSNNAVNNAFLNDSIFRRFYNGLAVIPTGSSANGLIYVNLADTSTKLEVHFRRKNKGVVDTLFESFHLSTIDYPPSIYEPGPSSVANNITRNYAGASISSPAAGEHYLQTTPGSYVNINIPALSTLSNRIIHRAELIVQQIPDNQDLDEKLSAPSFLYLDLKDTTITPNWKPIYYDLNPNQSYNPDSQLGYNYLPSTIDFITFGGYRRAGTDKFMNPIKYYNFNISRYVQQIVTKHTTNHTIRLFAPYELYYPQLGNSTFPAIPTQYGNRLAAGRVKIGGGTNPNYRMILRIVYSNL